MSTTVTNWNFEDGVSFEKFFESGHRLCGTEVDRKKCFLGLGRHFSAMSTIAPLVDIAGVTLLFVHDTKQILNLPF
jgi:hypothetical protein